MIDIEIKTQENEEGEEEVKVIEHNDLTPWGADARFKVVGKGYSRLEGSEKVTGRAQYAYDVRLPGQLYARVLRSPHPHAKVLKVDTREAEALAGVRAVISSETHPDISWYEEDQSKLFDRTVRFVGDEVAAVAADSEELAEDALRLIKVQYEPLPFVMGIEAALKSDAPKVYADKESNISGEESYSRGDIEAGFREADVIIEGSYSTQTALHNPLEPHGCTVRWQGEELTIWESTQSVFTVREDVAEKLELPAHRVRVIKEHMGGGFGAKQVAWKQTVIAALLAKVSGKPVQLMLDREAENLAAGNRNATRQKVKIGAKRDGTLTAIEVEVLLETGAYEVGGEASDVTAMFEELYRCPNVTSKQTAVFTHTGPTVAFRAPGYVEGAFALETILDKLARELGMDALELRLKNYVEFHQKQEKPYTLPEALRGCYEKATEAFGWHSYRRPPANGSKRRGIGLAAHSWMGGSGHPPAYAWVKLNGDGTVDVVTGTQDIGTGTRTGLAQVAAEELTLPLKDIALHLGDTATGPYSPVSSGSATQASLGPAIRAAALDAKRQLFEAAATILEEKVERLELHDGEVHVKGKSDKGLSIADIMKELSPHMILGQGARGPNPKDKTVRTFGAQCVEVEVDTDTGEVTLLRIATSHDCGRIINPTMVDSQVTGGIVQGIGFAMTEARAIDARYGVVLNANLEEYKIPTIQDVPEITHAQLGIPDLEANPTGAKGIGEPPLIPTAPAIANAIYDACGVRLDSTPFSRKKLLGALEAQRRKA